MLALMLILLPAAGEEMMFRGFLQGYCSRFFGRTLGLLLPAVLFAMRHHPSDIYFGHLNHASPAAWANRFTQLYRGALVFGFARESRFDLGDMADAHCRPRHDPRHRPTVESIHTLRQSL